MITYRKKFYDFNTARFLFTTVSFKNILTLRMIIKWNIEKMYNNKIPWGKSDDAKLTTLFDHIVTLYSFILLKTPNFNLKILFFLVDKKINDLLSYQISWNQNPDLRNYLKKEKILYFFLINGVESALLILEYTSWPV